MTANKTQLTALVTDWSKIPLETPSAGIERQMVVGENMMICRFKFVPFLATPAHRHPHEQMTLVLQGKVKFIVGDEEKIVAAGDVLHFPANSWHGATMLDEEVMLLDIFSPLREDFLQ